jgi:hypothetical protein
VISLLPQGHKPVGSKTGHRWLTCGFACGSGREAGSIAGL